LAGGVIESLKKTQRQGTAVTKGEEALTHVGGDLLHRVEVPLPDGSGEVVPGLVELEVAVPRLRPAEW